MSNTKVKVAEETKLAVAQVSFEDDSGAGLENVDAKSLAIPFIACLQALSPQCQDVKDGGVEGAKAGKFINTITNELYDSIKVIPVAFKREYLRWAPNRGGFRGSLNAADVDLNRVPGMSNHSGRILMDVIEGQPVLDAEGRPKFDFLSDTRNHFVLVQNSSGSWLPALISLGSTQIKKSKRWLSLISGVEMIKADGITKYTPPSFSHIYDISSVKEENDKGKWHGVSISLSRALDPSNPSDAAAYLKAKQFNHDVNAGAVEVSQPVDAESTEEKF
jgi:hypothetical protein